MIHLLRDELANELAVEAHRASGVPAMVRLLVLEVNRCLGATDLRYFDLSGGYDTGFSLIVCFHIKY